MTKEQILALSITEEEKTLVRNSFEAAERFGKPSKLEACADEVAVRALLNIMKKAYEARQAAQQRKLDKIKAAEETRKKVINLLSKANAAGFTTDEVIKAIEDMIKEKHNAELQAKIAELQAQLIQ